MIDPTHKPPPQFHLIPAAGGGGGQLGIFVGFYNIV